MKSSNGKIKADSLIVNYNSIDEGFAEKNRKKVEQNSSASIVHYRS